MSLTVSTDRVLHVVPTPRVLDVSESPPFVVRQATGVSVSDPSLLPLAQQFTADVRAATGLALTVRESTQPAEAGEIRIALVAGDPAIDALPVARGDSPKDGDPADERYRIDVAAGAIALSATAPEGAFRGLTTLLQIIATDLDVPACRIVDGPRLAWRGLSFDVVRTFFPPPDVRAVIDLLALYKMNVLHLHLTDDQGWRIEIDGWPKLTEIGGRGAVDDRPGGYYTKAEFEGLVAYAAERFITVVPEVDMPGHVSAATTAYPELYDPGSLSPRFGRLNPDDERTYRFVSEVLGQVADLAPAPFLHIGGDEPWGMDDQPYARFIDRVVPIVHGLGKKLVGWQEIARGSIGPGDIAQHWIDFDFAFVDRIDPENPPPNLTIPLDFLRIMRETFKNAGPDVALAVEKGARILLSPVSKLYLDGTYADEPADPAQRDALTRVGPPSSARGTVETSYAWDISAVAQGVGLDEERDIAGIEAAIWCERVATFSDLQFLLLPRIPGIAEKGWSDATATPWPAHRTKLALHARTWERHGWNYFRSALVDWHHTAR